MDDRKGEGKVVRRMTIRVWVKEELKEEKGEDIRQKCYTT